MSKLQGNSSFKNSIRNMQLEKFKKTTIAGIPIKQSTETLEDYIYTKKGQQDTTLANGEKYTITGFFQVNKVSTYIKVININNTNKVIYNDSSINVTLSGDKSYIYFEGKLSNTPLKYKFYFASNTWKQIVTEDNTEVEKEITKFNELSYFYDESKCSDPYLLALLSGLDGVDYEEILVKLKDALNNLSEFNYGYTNTGIKYGNRYMLPKNLSLGSMLALEGSGLLGDTEDDSNSIGLEAMLLGDVYLYNQNSKIQKQFNTFVNDDTYILPQEILPADKEYIQEKLSDYLGYYDQMMELTSGSGNSQIDDGQIAFQSTNLGKGPIAHDGDIVPISRGPELFLYNVNFDGYIKIMLNPLIQRTISQSGIMNTISAVMNFLYNGNSALVTQIYHCNLVTEYDDNDHPFVSAIRFSLEGGKNLDNTKSSIYPISETSNIGFVIRNPLYEVKYNTSLLCYILETAETYATSLEDGEEKTHRLNECSIFRNMLTTSDLILKRILNSGAQVGPFDDYKYSFSFDISTLVSMIGGNSGGTIVKDPGRSIGTRDKVSAVPENDNDMNELTLFSMIKFKIKSVSRNINLQYNLGNLNWYDSNGNLIDPSIEDLKFTITENDYVSPILAAILELNPYNEFEKEPIKMTELKKAYYDEEVNTTIPSFAMLQVSNDLTDIKPETDSYETIRNAVYNFLDIPIPQESSGEVEENQGNSETLETVIDSVTPGNWTQTTKDGITVYQSDPIDVSQGNDRYNTSMSYTISGIGNAVIHIMSDAEGLSYDYCYVLVDGNEVISTGYFGDDEIEGSPYQNIWYHYPIYINDNNSHVIQIYFTKDSDFSEGEDCAWCYLTLNDADTGNYDYTAPAGGNSSSISIPKELFLQSTLSDILHELAHSETEAKKLFDFLDANPNIKNNLFNVIYYDFNLKGYKALLLNNYYNDDYLTYIVEDYMNKNGTDFMNDSIPSGQVFDSINAGDSDSNSNNNILSEIMNVSMANITLINYEELYLILNLLYANQNYNPSNDESYSVIQGFFKIVETLQTPNNVSTRLNLNNNPEYTFQTYIYTKENGWEIANSDSGSNTPIHIEPSNPGQLVGA